MISTFKIDGYKIRGALADSGLSVEQLSKRSGLAVVNIYRYCKGKGIKIENLQKVAKALGVKPSSLIQ